MTRKSGKSRDQKKKTSFLGFSFRMTAFLCWSVWLFVLGVLAGKGMIPDYLRIDYMINKITGTETSQTPALASQEEENDEFSNFRFEVIETLGGEAGAETTQRKKKRTTKRYTVQIASVRNVQQAEHFVSKLKKMGIAGELHPFTNKGKTWYAIRSGVFSSLEDAREFAGQVSERAPYKPLVVRLAE